MRKVSIIIVTWNCREYARSCLDSLAKSVNGDFAETIVVDNGSTDGTPGLVRSGYPHVLLKEPGRNLGFAAANNLAIRESGGDYILLLNPDTEVFPNALETLIEFMDAHAGAWAVGPMLLNTDGTLQRTGVRFPSLVNLLAEAFFLDRVFPQSRWFGAHRELYLDPDLPRQVDFLQGSCLLVRREQVLQHVGLLDEGFFMYFEETDWCYRMKQSGGEVWLCPAARVVHHGGGEEGHYDERRLIFYHQSLFRFVGKYFSPSKVVAVRIIVFLRSFLRIVVWGMIVLVRPTMRSKGSSTLRGYMHVLRLCFSSSTQSARALPKPRDTVAP